jgi:hypothetical protein
MSKLEGIRTINDLVSEQLNEVSFVMDYVEFHFNGPVLRALSSPIVETPAGRFEFPHVGSRDALCSLIERDVLAVRVDVNRCIELDLTGNAKLTIPLDRASRKNPEAANFQTARFHSPIMNVW